MHHSYQLRYHETYAELLPKSGGFLLCRTGRFGDQKRVGDLARRHGCDVCEPPAAVERPRRENVSQRRRSASDGGDGNQLGCVGIPVLWRRYGRFPSQSADKELYIRWFQQTALSSVMQVGDSTSQTPGIYAGKMDATKKRSICIESTPGCICGCFRMNGRWRRSLHRRDDRSKRPVGLAYPRLGQHPSDEYLFGDDLLVAPVLGSCLVPAAATCCFPPGDWVDFLAARSFPETTTHHHRRCAAFQAATVCPERVRFAAAASGDRYAVPDDRSKGGIVCARSGKTVRRRHIRRPGE